MEQHRLGEGLTFDDILLVPASSEILPRTTDLSARLTRRISLQIPLISAAMDTVTESRTAIAIAQEGGIGVVHKNLTVEAQAAQVGRVKKFESGMVADPLTVSPTQTLSEALGLMQRSHISGLPVTENGRLVGILTNRDLRFERRLERTVGEVMTHRNLVTAPPGVTLDEATLKLHEHRIEKLLVVEEDLRLVGLITVKDIEKAKQFPHACRDDRGRLRVGAAVGVGADWQERAEALIEAGADIICVDTAHGHSKNVLETVRALKKSHPDLDVLAGNVGTGDGVRALIDAGADAVKVGMGVGSICTTRIISGVGMPQVTAIVDAAKVARDANIPIVADGGIRFSGDVVKSLACGADAVMIGSLFAGTEESPGETILYQGRTYKMYRGMGSIEAMRAGSKDRYFQDDEEDAIKLVPEGIEGRVPYKGSLSSNIHQLVGGVRAGMGYMGVPTLDQLRAEAKYIRISEAGHRESHVHDVVVAKEAPNYRLG
ncbi:MAG: IMP dehydrogenase [Candidatus Binatia bacterium]|nr:IMP dehydrogenase [Candidatus Binatia bacterium]